MQNENKDQTINEEIDCSEQDKDNLCEQFWNAKDYEFFNKRTLSAILNVSIAWINKKVSNNDFIRTFQYEGITSFQKKDIIEWLDQMKINNDLERQKEEV